ncbi:MAG: glycosyltransferase family 2 protein [Thomasclavelia sp.]|uniref:glycosyltransferase family 2 protein n=1 Tax=Thomasclavelia sp. TaxID=3025757 RepID=UPI0039A240B8
MKVLVIIPAYNEEENILRVVKRLEKENTNCDYIVINDCSKDKTPLILDENNINHIDLPVNLGLTGAVQTGYKYAYENGYDAAIQFDGDGQHLPEYIEAMVTEIENGYDIVIGSRFVNEKKHMSARMLGSRLITFMIKLTTGKKINDPTSGMRIINRELIKDYAYEVNRKPEPDTLAYQIKKGYRVKEIQVKMEDRVAGTSIYTGIGSSISYMMKVLVTIIFFN